MTRIIPKQMRPTWQAFRIPFLHFALLFILRKKQFPFAVGIYVQLQTTEKANMWVEYQKYIHPRLVW